MLRLCFVVLYYVFSCVYAHGSTFFLKGGFNDWGEANPFLSVDGNLVTYAKLNAGTNNVVIANGENDLFLNRKGSHNLFNLIEENKVYRTNVTIDQLESPTLPYLYPVLKIKTDKEVSVQIKLINDTPGSDIFEVELRVFDGSPDDGCRYEGDEWIDIDVSKVFSNGTELLESGTNQLGVVIGGIVSFRLDDEKDYLLIEERKSNRHSAPDSAIFCT